MSKSHMAASALFLLAALLLSGCAEQDSGLNTNLDSGSLCEQDKNSDSTSENRSEAKSGEDSKNNPEESSDVNVAAVPVEFTEEDKDLQDILENLEEGRSIVNNWFACAEPIDAECIPYQFFFPESTVPDHDMEYFKIPVNYSENGVTIPHTYNGMREFILEYYSEQSADNLMKDVAQGNMLKNSDGTFSVILDEKFKGNEFSKFLEIDGIMYRKSSLGVFYPPAGLIIDCATAKVISKTDTAIEFTYLEGDFAQADLNKTYLNNVSLYEENAMIGVLKYERDGWKRDWDKT